MTKTKLYTIGAAVALAAALVAFVVVARGDAPARAGALLVDPPNVSIAGEGTEASLTLTNDGTSSVGFDLTSDETWLAVQPAEGVVGAGEAATVSLAADRSGLAAGTHEASVVVGTVDGSAVIPVRLVVGEGVAASGPARLQATTSLRFEPTSTAADLRITNAGGEPLRWQAVPGDPFVLLERTQGTVEGGGSTILRVSIDRSGLGTGSARSAIDVTSNGGDVNVGIQIETEAIPLLVVPDATLDFGSARDGSTTLALEVRNGGLASLRYQVSIARAWLRIEEGAAATIEPGERSEVRVSYLFDRAPEGPQDLTLKITSDGGDAVVAVRGVRDTFAPYANDRRMGQARERCPGGSCALYRTASATVVDDTDITEVHVRFQVCTEGPQSDVTCSDFEFVEMKRTTGDTFTAEAGPLPSCTTGRRSYIPWHIYTEDSLGNVRLLPGSKTPEIRPHCRTDGSTA